MAPPGSDGLPVGGDLEGVEVNVDRPDRQVWIVKVPKFVDAAWKRALEDAHRDGAPKRVGEVTPKEGSGSTHVADGARAPESQALACETADLGTR